MGNQLSNSSVTKSENESSWIFLETEIFYSPYNADDKVDVKI